MDKKYYESLYDKPEVDVPEKRKGFAEALGDLRNSEVPVLDDSLQKTQAVDVPREKIDKLQMKQISPPQDSMAKVTEFRIKRDAQRAAAGLPPLSVGETYTAPTAAAKPAQVAENVYDAAAAKKEFIAKNKFNRGAKKMLGAVPVLGTVLAGYAALDSGDAMAGIPILNEAGDAGLSADAERQMLAEHDARVAYDKSPARLARLAALKKLGQ